MTNIEKIKQLAGAVDTDLQEEVESVVIGIFTKLAISSSISLITQNIDWRRLTYSCK